MKKKVYMDNIEEVGTKLTNYSKNDISNKIKELKVITKNLIWEGEGYQSYMDNYTLKIDKLMKINNNLTLLAEYLIKVKDNYNEANNQIQNYYEELMNSIDDLRR